MEQMEQMFQNGTRVKQKNNKKCYQNLVVNTFFVSLQYQKHSSIKILKINLLVLCMGEVAEMPSKPLCGLVTLNNGLFYLPKYTVLC